MVASKGAKRGKSKKKGRVIAAPIPKATRPLNSWIAFRSKCLSDTAAWYALTYMRTGYYSAIFASLQQKDISGFLTYMWQNDPFKAKWSILAKAYSVIRDEQGKHKASLEEFLAINGPLIGIIEPADYLQKVGWEIGVDGLGQVVVSHSPKGINTRDFACNISVNDVIQNSYHRGYFKGNLFNVLLPDHEATIAMATSVQHAGNSNQVHGNEGAVNSSIQHHASSFKAAHQQKTITASQGSGEGENVDAYTRSGDVAVMTQSSNSGISNNNVYATAPVTHEGGFGTEAAASNAMVAMSATPLDATSYTTPANDASFDWDSWLVGAGMEEITEQNENVAKKPPPEKLNPNDFELDDEWPFNASFDPDSPSFVFDPFEGNQFDAFDMSDGFSHPTHLN